MGYLEILRLLCFVFAIISGISSLITAINIVCFVKRDKIKALKEERLARKNAKLKAKYEKITKENNAKYAQFLKDIEKK